MSTSQAMFIKSAQSYQGRTKFLARGYSLIEILVLLIIIGIAASMVVLSVGAGNRPDQLKADVEKLTGLMQLALEEAVLTSKPLGLRFGSQLDTEGTQSSYEWSAYLERQWEPIAGHSYFSEQQLTPGTALELSFGGRVALLDDDSDAGLQLGLPQNEDADETDQPDDPQSARKYQPDVFFLHSGEITPAFELLISAENVAAEYQIEANPLGQIRLRRRNDLDSEWLSVDGKDSGIIE